MPNSGSRVFDPRGKFALGPWLDDPNRSMANRDQHRNLESGSGGNRRTPDELGVEQFSGR